MVQRWSFGSVNVPYESLYPEINLNPNKDAAHFASMYQLGEDIKSKLQAICFVYTDQYNGYENEMMWAQYAENHCGVCLEIDTDLFLEENKDIEIFKFQDVTYNPKKNNKWIDWNPNKTKDENIRHHIEKDFGELFLSKSHYWDKEFEKRLLILQDDFCYFKIKNSLTGIYYGLSTNHNYDAAIQYLIDPERTKTYRVYFESNKLKRMERRR